ncbi:MAG: TRAP transporter small permease [Candidatus Hodarchaeota archaeon]
MLNQIIQNAQTVVNSVSRIASLLGTAALIIMMGLVVTDVFLRYFVHRPIPGIPELVEVAMVTIAFLSLAWCAVRKGNVKVELVVSRFSARVQAAFDIIAHLTGLVVFSALSLVGFLEAGHMWRIDNVSRTLHVPSYPFFLVLAVGSAMLCLVLLVDLVRSVAEVIKR